MTPPSISDGTTFEKGTPIPARLLVLGLVFALLASAPAQAFSLMGGQGSKNRENQRPFLPPVASINGKLEDVPFEANVADPFEPVTLSAVSAPALRTGSRVKKLDDPVKLRPDEEFMALVKLRQTQDEEDLDLLWQAVIERNPVIRFSMEKLMMPADLKNKHSAMFGKVVSTLIQGAALGSQVLLNTGAYQQMGMMATGQAVDNIITGRNKPTPGAHLSPTEQIQLAGLIDELKGKLIQTYTDYKNTLQLLSEARQVTVKNNNLYSRALASGNEMSMMAAASAYYKALHHETELRQKARLQHIKLERLAGHETVEKLELAVMVPEPLRKNLPVHTATTERQPKTAFPKQRPPESTPPDPMIGPLKDGTPKEESASSNTSFDAAFEATSNDFIGPPLELAPDILPFGQAGEEEEGQSPPKPIGNRLY